MRNAVENGYVDCLCYVHRLGIPWNTFICQNVAAKGQFDCLKYIHENGCDWDVDTYLMFHANGQ